MTENPNTDNNTVSPTPAEATPTEHMIPKSRFDEINNQLRELKAQLEQSQSEKQRQAEQKLAEEKRWQELAEQRQVEIDKLKSVEVEAQRLRASFESNLKARLERIPEDKREYLPDFDDPIKLSAWLDKAESLFIDTAKPKAPNLNGGSGSGGSSESSSTALSAGTQSVLDIARQYGYSVNEDRVAQFARNPIQPTETGE